MAQTPEIWRTGPLHGYAGRAGKNKDKKDYVVKADSTPEREARDQVRKQIDRYISTRKNRETPMRISAHFVNAITGLMDPHTDYFPDRSEVFQ